jgi:DNA phosphorothioation-dependent restriction protein DptG
MIVNLANVSKPFATNHPNSTNTNAYTNSGLTIFADMWFNADEIVDILLAARVSASEQSLGRAVRAFRPFLAGFLQGKAAFQVSTCIYIYIYLYLFIYLFIIYYLLFII